MAKEVEEPTQGDRPSQGEMSECEIDANVEDTFPASDPPSWTLGTDHSTEPPDASATKRPEDD